MRARPAQFRAECAATPFCPGCGHGVLMNVVLRAVDRLGLTDRDTLFVSGIGCAAWIPSPHFNFDTLHTLHGRAVAFATGAKLANPKLTTIVVSGDGDLLSIGGNHLIHAARRGVDITVISGNNFVFGMTGGQSAPTTPLNAITVTAPTGVDQRPLDACDLVMAAGAGYAARYPVTRPIELGAAIEKAIRFKGFSFVDAISPCPTQYGRRNNLGDISNLFDMVDQRCVTQTAFDALPESEQPYYIVIGERTR
jgi:2-oxoglutarate/2-oxoacid ferredoxin oxidoreductase subunit beta